MSKTWIDCTHQHCIDGRGTLTEIIRQALRDKGWEIYEGLEHPDLYEWWWKPAEHKDYWSIPTGSRAGQRDDWYMPIDQAIGQQMLADRLAEEKRTGKRVPR